MTSTNVPSRIRDRVRRYALSHGLLGPGPLVVAVSGGTDSTALLLLLADLAPELGLVLHVAHFDHRIRHGGAADAQLVSDLAASAGASIRVGRAEAVPRSEDEARRARYAFLRRTAAERGAKAIATGHTRDDQAETVLLHLTRGSGLTGLAGMRPSRDGVVRPLLCVGRAETAEVCRAAGVAPREDPSNRSLRYARNRIRRRVLPELAVIDPRVATAIARLADAAAAASDAARARAEAALEASERSGSIDLGELEAAARTAGPGTDPLVREEALAIAWERATGRGLSARQRGALAAMCERRDGTRSIDLPGGRAVREYGSLRVERRGERPRASKGAADETPPSRGGTPAPPPRGVPLPLGGSIEWEGWRIELRASDAGDGSSLRTGVPPARAAGLTVRARRAGDRMAGVPRAKLQDLLINAKIPLRQRPHLPVVVTCEGDVAWVPGIASAWNGLSEGYVLVARPPAAWHMPVRTAGRRVASLEKGREDH